MVNWKVIGIASSAICVIGAFYLDHEINYKSKGQYMSRLYEINNELGKTYNTKEILEDNELSSKLERLIEEKKEIEDSDSLHQERQHYRSEKLPEAIIGFGIGVSGFLGLILSARKLNKI